jgi:hypothetical protein
VVDSVVMQHTVHFKRWISMKFKTDITDDQIDAIFDDSPFVARNVLSGGAYEVVQRENADWRDLITNDEPKHHGYFDTFEEAEIVRRRLHTRWILSGA